MPSHLYSKRTEENPRVIVMAGFAIETRRIYVKCYNATMSEIATTEWPQAVWIRRAPPRGPPTN